MQVIAQSIGIEAEAELIGRTTGRRHRSDWRSVTAPQHLLCSFDGTAFLIRALGSLVRACQNRGWVAFQTNLF
jgi:hypothetical protein